MKVQQIILEQTPQYKTHFVPGFGIVDDSNHLIACIFTNFGIGRKGLIVTGLTLTVVPLTKKSKELVRETDSEFPRLHTHAWSS